MRISRTGNCSCFWQGFVLIELLAVIFVLALVVAVVMPSFNTPKGTLKRESGRMASSIRSLYESTVSRKEQSSMAFDLDEREVSWKVGERNGSLSFSTLSAVELPSRGLVKEGRLIVFISPSGGNEHMTIYFQDGTDSMSVSFNPISGRTRVSESEIPE